MSRRDTEMAGSRVSVHRFWRRVFQAHPAWEASYAAGVIPWIIIAVVAVPLVVIAFVAIRRSTTAGEHPASEDAQARAQTEQEFAQAEAYEAKWHEEDKESYHQERLP